MASSIKNLSEHDPSQIPSGKGKRFGIVVSEWNAEITNTLLNGCLETLEKYDVTPGNIQVLHVPGAFELPFGAQNLSEKYTLHGIICLGCVIKGDTSHDVYISHAVSTGIMQLSLSLSLPIIFGVLTPNNMQQALDRAGGKYGNKGVEAAITALKMAAI